MKARHCRDRHGRNRSLGLLLAGFVVLWLCVVGVRGQTYECDGESSCDCIMTAEGWLEVNCSARGLTKVPSFLRGNSNVTSLSLSDNNITAINETDFEGMRELSSLDLGGNRLMYIANNSFRDIPNFELLDLCRNSLDDASLAPLSFLRLSIGVLDLSHNLLTKPPRALANATSLTTVFLHHNRIEVLRSNGFDGYPQSLISLDLSGNGMYLIEPKALDYSHFYLLQQLWLDNNNFVSINSSFFTGMGVKRLSIANSSIQYMAKSTFAPLIALDQLILRDNNFSNLERNVFKDLDVDILDLSNCGIQRLTRGFLRCVVHRELHLERNNISLIQERAFVGLRGAPVIVLSESNVEVLEGSPFDGLDVEELYLDHNKISPESEEDFLLSMTQLIILDISGNNFESLPDLSHLRLLTEFFAGNNHLQRIEADAFQNNSYISTLNLGGNQELTYIHPDAFLTLGRVTEIDLSHTNIETLPSLRNCHSLLSLEVISSSLTSLPEDLCSHAPDLITIDVTENQLTSIPLLHGCSKLSIALFGDNYISSLDSLPFTGLIILQTIRLEYNALTSIPPTVFNGLINLRFLYLHNNDIAGLSNETFAGLTQLRTLELYRNAITELPQGVFSSQGSLEYLYIQDNHISVVGSNLFHDNMTSLKVLNMSNNSGLSDLPIPKGGFPALQNLALMNLPKLYNVPDPAQVPRLLRANFTYAYHCCIYKDYVRGNLEPIPVDSSTSTAAENDLYEYEQGILTVNLPSVAPLTLPPEVTEGLIFEEQNPWNPNNHDISKQELEAFLTSLSQQHNISFVTHPNGQIDLVITDNDVNMVVSTDQQDKLLTLAAPSSPPFDSSLSPYIECYPLPDALSPCENLMDPMVLRVFVWMVCVLAILGNLSVLFVTVASREKKDVPQMLVCNLAFADFLVGVYLAFLGIVDIRTFGNSSFYESAIQWQNGPGCQAAGFIAIFSSQLSVFLLVLITLERLQTVAYSFKHCIRLRMWNSLLLVAVCWIVALILAILPIVGINSYTDVAICLPFSTDTAADKGYIGLLLSLNLIGLLVIFFSYVHILMIFRQSPAANKSFKERVGLSIKLALLILFYVICWLPLIVVGYGAIFGEYLIDITTAKFFIVLVFPFNAVFNPFLYAFVTRKFRQRVFGICRQASNTVPMISNSQNSHRRNSLPFVSCSNTGTLRNNSPRYSASSDINMEFLALRQSRRSNSFTSQYLHSHYPLTAMGGSSNPLPYLGRRNSSPAVFSTELSRPVFKLPSDPTLPGVEEETEHEIEVETSFSSPGQQRVRQGQASLPVVREDDLEYACEDEDDNRTDEGIEMALSARQRDSTDSDDPLRLPCAGRSLSRGCRSEHTDSAVDDDLERSSVCSSDSENFVDAPEQLAASHPGAGYALPPCRSLATSDGPSHLSPPHPSQTNSLSVSSSSSCRTSSHRNSREHPRTNVIRIFNPHILSKLPSDETDV